MIRAFAGIAGSACGSIAIAVALGWSSPSAAQTTPTVTVTGKLDVDARGQAMYTIPIEVPPGTAGMAPVLSLQYNSGQGNGLLGVGWSLTGLPAITRCGQTIAQDGQRTGINYDNNDKFCLAGQRLFAISGTYGADGTEYRTEIEGFSRIISHGSAGNGPAFFLVFSKSGQILEFGNTTDSRILAQHRPTARVWAVDKISDTKGNYLTVTYNNDTANGQYYPTRIDYTGNTAAGLTPYAFVEFDYATRGDAITFYEGGSVQTTTVLLTHIKTNNTLLVNDYRLAYRQGTATTNSELTSITRCGGDGSCLAPTTLTWQGGTGTLSLATGQTPAFGSFELIPGDWNGDGRTGLLLHSKSASTASQLYLADENGNLNATSFSATGWDAYTIITGDWNGDGKTDIALIAPAGTSLTSHFYISTGTSFQLMGFDPTGWAAFNVITGDWDGDGRTDIALIGRNPGDTSHLLLSTGTTFNDTGFAPTTWGGHTVLPGDWIGEGRTGLVVVGLNQAEPATFYRSTGTAMTATGATLTLGGQSWDGYQLIIGDFNGDGRADFILHNPKYAGRSSFLFLGDGAGGFAYSGFSAAWGGNNLLVGDWNGDGKTDIALVSEASGGNATFFLSSGTGLVASNLVQSNVGGNVLTLGNWNGDGASDLWMSVANSTASTQFLSAFTPERLITINNGIGASTTITYDRLTKSAVYTKNATAKYPVMDITFPGYVVTRVDASNGVGGSYSSTYTYSGAQVDLSGRGFLGYAQITATDLQSNVVQNTKFLQGFPQTGLIWEQQKLLNGKQINLKKNFYTATNLGGTRTQIFLNESTDSSVDLDGTAMPFTDTKYQYDAFGNATQIAVSTPDGATKTTTNTYTNDTTNWLLGRLTRATVTSTLP